MGQRISRQAITPGVPQSKQPSDAKQLRGKRKSERRPAKTDRSAVQVSATPELSLDEPQPSVAACARPQSTTLVHQQQFQTASSAGSVVITIRMLKMEPNDLKEFVQQHHRQQQQHQHQPPRSNPILKYEHHTLSNQRQRVLDFSNNNNNNNQHHNDSSGSNIINNRHDNTGNQLDNRFKFASNQFNCDNSNTATSEDDEQNGNWSMTNSALPLDIEQKINAISLCDGSENDASNSDALAAAATRLPFERLTKNSIFASAFRATQNDGAEVKNMNENNDSGDAQCTQCQKRKKSHQKCDKNCSKESKMKKSNWGLRFNCAKLKRASSALSQPHPAVSSASEACAMQSPAATILDPSIAPESALQPNMMEIDIVPEMNSMIANGSAPFFTSSVTNAATAAVAANNSTALLLDNSPACNGSNVILVSMNEQPQPLLDFARYSPEDYPIEDCDKKARLQRAIEIEEGVEPPPGFMPSSSLINVDMPASEGPLLSPPAIVNTVCASSPAPTHWHMLCSTDASLHLMIPNLMQHSDEIPRIHSQVDYIHCLVPDLKKITSCSFYWGKMDRYEAERLLDGKAEGTFLLRDSAQEEFLFSVSFRKYGRSLHARIEQFNHKFSFDCHDPGVYTSSTVTGLLEHYKDPACVMFFEPALTLPLNRNNVFSLQQLCRATIVSSTTYDGIDSIGSLPKKVKSYLKEYHYKQRVRVKRFDEPYYCAS